MLGEAALLELCGLSEERELGRWKHVRPSHSIFVLVYGQMGMRQDADTSSLTGALPPELILTAPSVPVAVAAAAVALDCGVAGTASEPGATFGAWRWRLSDGSLMAL